MDDTIKSLLEDYLLESRERLERLEEILLGIASGEDVEESIGEIRLQLHTLKGNSGMMGFRDLQSVAHGLEDLAPELRESTGVLDGMLAGVDRFREMLREVEGGRHDPDFDPGPLAREVQGGLRVAFSDLDDLVDRLGEMVIYRNRLEEALARGRGAGAQRGSGIADEGIFRAYEQLATSLEALRDGVMRLRMVPLSTLFRPLARIVHDESRRAAKPIRFVTEGGDTPLDKALLEVASEALGHLVRNAVVHGIEPAERRSRAGKGDGLIRLSAAADSREVRIEVLDDGQGVDRKAVAEEAERIGAPLEPGSDPLQLLFLSGFSTRADGADLSAGRGVGLAAVREAVSRKGGRIEVFSEEGVGTLFRLRLPLSVSITRALLLGCDGEDYVLPLTAVAESVELRPDVVNEINGALVLTWRGGLIPLLDLGYSFGTSGERRRAGIAVVLESEGEHRAVAVDRIHGLREVVVRGLDELAGEARGVAGTTILGDGRAVLILDPGGLMALSPFGPDSGGQRGRSH